MSDERRRGDGAEAIGAEALFRAHHRFVTGFLVALGVHSAELDDLAQEVFLVAHRRGGFVPGKAKPTTWLASIAFFVASTSRRSRRRRRDKPDEDTLDQARALGANPEESASTSQTVARVNRALAELDVEKRALFLLFEVEGESCDALAAAFAIPIGTVYSRLHAARADFRRAYDALAKHDGTRAQAGMRPAFESEVSP
jgi:RNA polymerase sigma-70 factor (ECF subfamily)